jgi:ATP-dependent RNA helicase DDX41
VNVGRAGAANLNVIQEVEFVNKEAKVVHLLECLQKTAPPVLIFCERQGDVEEVYEYLILKGVKSCSIHGGKSQHERNLSIEQFKKKEKDVLVATDVAAKGLDFPNIQHVILFDMPNVIEDYVHRIGRTGRGGKTGVATTFVGRGVEESVLADLTALLVEAKQRVPPFLEPFIPKSMNPDLQILLNPGNNNDSSTSGGDCSYCAGLGHRITNCPKLQAVSRKVGASLKDTLGGNGGYGGDY